MTDSSATPEPEDEDLDQWKGSQQIVRDAASKTSDQAGDTESGPSDEQQEELNDEHINPLRFFPTE
ncbi:MULTISPECIES: hypothetical protein [Streptomyces]|uniref:Uncharacterized protein n=1 Tax=Streptomyces luteosporeus TaxID=173856 RepID=A0ABN3TIV6_9ACTN